MRKAVKVRTIIAGVIAVICLLALLIHPGDPTFVAALTLTLGYIFGTADASGVGLPLRRKPPPEDGPPV